jgi:rubrerythrin
MSKLRIEYLTTGQVISCMACKHVCGGTAPSKCPECHAVFDEVIVQFQDGTERELSLGKEAA